MPSAIRHAPSSRRGGRQRPGSFARSIAGFGSARLTRRRTSPRTGASDEGGGGGALDLAADPSSPVNQIHSPEVVFVETPWRREDNPRREGMSRSPRRRARPPPRRLHAVFVRRAVPGSSAGVPCRRRGALGGVIVGDVPRWRCSAGHPTRIRAAIGPCIAQRSYDVARIPRPLPRRDAGNVELFRAGAPATGISCFDLPIYVERRRGRAGNRALQPRHATPFAE